MENFCYQTTVMWAQIDANQHMRHSAYADIAAHARVMLMDELGLTAQLFLKNHLGPVLFREELIYLKEVNMSEKISVSCQLVKCKRDGSKWSLRHQIMKSSGEIAAIINVDGAWIDLVKRKITGLPEDILSKFLMIPLSEDYLVD